MVIDEKNIESHELIGLVARIVGSSNRSEIGIHGKVVDETRNTISIGKKMILKKDVKIEFTINDKKVLVDGNSLLKGPVERIKSR